MARTYRALAALLVLSDRGAAGATGEIAAALAEEGLVPAPQRAAIDALLAELAERDIYDLQERYFALFDRSRTLSLHLFEHVHGESRDRGQAMADLIDALSPAMGSSRPPANCRTSCRCSWSSSRCCPDDEARALLAEPAGILRALADRLVARDSAYAAVFQALADAGATRRRSSVPRYRAGRPQRSRGAGCGLGGSGGPFRPRRSRSTVAAPTGCGPGFAPPRGDAAAA